MIKTSVSLAQCEHYQQVLNTLGIVRWAKRDAVVAPLQDLAFADDCTNANTNADMAQVVQMTDAVTHTEKQPVKENAKLEIKKETKQEIKEPQTTKQNTEKTSHTNDHAGNTLAEQSEAARTENQAEPCPAFSLYAVAYKNWLLLADDSMMLSDNSSALKLWQSLTAALAKEINQKTLPVQQFDFPLLDEPSTHTFSSASAAVTGWLYSMRQQMQPIEQGGTQHKVSVGLLAEIDDRLLTSSSEVIDITQFPQPLEFMQLPTLAHMLADWQLKKSLWKKVNEGNK